jgi:hypothetical protein
LAYAIQLSGTASTSNIEILERFQSKALHMIPDAPWYVPNTAIRKNSWIFGPRKDEVTGEWRKLRIEELHDLYSLPSIIRIMKSRGMRWAEHVARLGEKRNAYRLLVGKLEGKMPLGRPRRRRVDNIRMDHGLIWVGIGAGGELL